jgi:peptidoglycan hydrolase-like protein with peptidoglycan-binding domain
MTNQNADRSSMGGKHQQVMRAQEALNKQGASLKVDGVLGSQTRDAVKKFQEAHQLKPTGTLDRQTVAQLQM